MTSPAGVKPGVTLVLAGSNQLIVTPGLTRGRACYPFSNMARERQGGWVYIMADRYRGGIYVGVTVDLAARAQQHRNGTGSAYCAERGLTRLVWAEFGADIAACITHEKRLKRWRREWKFALIENANPDWRDLFDSLV